MSLENNLGKFATHLRIQRDIPFLTLPDQDRELPTLKLIDDLILRLSTDEIVTAEAQTILEEYSGRNSELQQWCNVILNERREAAPISHHVPIERLKSPLIKINSSDDRQILAETYGFTFTQFGNLLNNLGFWSRVGPELERARSDEEGIEDKNVDWDNLQFSIDHPQFLTLLNVLNGSARLDYEKIFPELAGWFNKIKKHKYHLSETEITEKEKTGRSPLSTADILTGLTIHKMNELLPSGIKQELLQLHPLIEDDSISTDQRIVIYHRLHEIYKDQESNKRLASALQKTEKELLLPPHHIGACDDLTQLDTVDVVVPIASFDREHHGYLTREVIARFPDALVCPSGGHQPHNVKTLGNIETKATEADGFVAAMLAESYEYELEAYPNHLPYVQFPPLHLFDIISPDTAAFDTNTNASNTADRLQAIQLNKKGQPPLKIVVITSDMHSGRAYADYRKMIPYRLASDIKVWPYAGSPYLRGVDTDRNTTGMGCMFGEYLKRLYMIATDSLTIY